MERLTWSVIAGGLLMAGLLLQTTRGASGTSSALFVAAGAAFIWGLTRR